MKVREIPKKVFMKLEVDDLEIKSIDDKTRTIWHKITKEVKDRMGDIVRIDGINLKNFKKKPGVLADHNYWGSNPPPVIGEGIGFKKEGKALYAGTKFFDPENDEMSEALRDLSKDHYALQKMKLLGWSIGFMPTKTEMVKDKEGNFQGYDFKESELLEYSSVVIPANQEAITEAFTKGLITKEFAEGIKKKDEPLPEILTINDIGKTEDELEVEPEPEEEPEEEPIPDPEPEPVEDDDTKELPEQQGLPPDEIKLLSDKIDSVAKKKKELRELLEKLKRRY